MIFSKLIYIMVKYYLTNGEYVDEDIIENFHNIIRFNKIDSNYLKLIEEWKSAGRSASRLARSASRTVKSSSGTLKVITKIVDNGISAVVKSSAIVIDPISNDITNTTLIIGNTMSKFSKSVISSSLKDFTIIGKELKNYKSLLDSNNY